MKSSRRAKLTLTLTATGLVVLGVVVLVQPSGHGTAAAATNPASVSSPSHDVPSATDGSSSQAASTSIGSSSSHTTSASRPATSPDSPSGTGSGSVRQQPSKSQPAGAGLDDPRKKEIAMELVSSAENSTLDWRAQYKYIEDINDGRGYTGGLIGFTSGTGDMLELVQHYDALAPNNILAKYLGALQSVNGTASHAGLDPNFTGDWVTAANDPLFQKAQDDERDRVYFGPAVSQAKADGLRTLGQFIYYDAMVMHGPGSEPLSFGGIRAAALKRAKPPSQGGDETAYLNAFLDARTVAMKADPSHQDTSRIDTEQRVFLRAGNLNLNTPLHWSTYGDPYTIN